LHHWISVAKAGFIMSTISENIKLLRERIEEACARVGRDPDEIVTVAVTKTVPPSRIQEAVEAGITILGENRVQEASSKITEVKGDVSWHMVGHLQRNKVKKAIEMFDMIQSVDSIQLAQEIERRCAQAGRTLDVLVEVNTSGEKTKFGVSPASTLDLVAEISQLTNIRVKGLMTIGAFTENENVVRTGFTTLRRLADQIEAAHISGVEMRFLSMGMSSDYIWAIEEGSNMLRIGTAIFGPRQF